jgi:hypothetical protein
MSENTNEYLVPNTPPKFKVGDRVQKTWLNDTGAIGTILVMGTDKTKTIYIYQVRFPACEVVLTERELKLVE